MANQRKVKTDVILKEFWRQNDRFADLFNAVVFQGKQVLRPEDLHEMDTDMSGIIRFRNYEESLVRTRDVVKKTAYGVGFAVLGIESQQKIHYAMPLRTMLYDAMGYLKEYQELVHSRKEERKNKAGDEFLSGMRKEDRLHPIISIVIYYGEKDWDGPTGLKDMIVKMPEEIGSIFSDYRMNLVQVRSSDGYRFHNEDVRTVFEIARELFRGDFEKIAARYKDREIKTELMTVIGKITESADLVKQAGEREATVNMCTALERLKNEGRQEGRQEGYQEKERELILAWTKEGYSTEMIARLLKRPEEFVREIQKDCEILA